MRILLDEEESEEYLANRDAAKSAQYFKENGWEPFAKLPDFAAHPKLLPKGCKLRPPGYKTHWPSHHKEQIMTMYAAGKYLREIAQELGMNAESVKHLVYAEKAKARKKELENYPSQEVTDWIQEASQKLAANGSTKPIGIATEEPESPTRTLLGALAVMMAQRCSVVSMMTMLNAEFGTNYTKEDITKMRSEL